MIDFTLAELLTGLDMSDREADGDYRLRVRDAMLAAGANASDLETLSVIFAYELDTIGKHYGVTRSEATEAEKPER